MHFHNTHRPIIEESPTPIERRCVECWKVLTQEELTGRPIQVCFDCDIYFDWEKISEDVRNGLFPFTFNEEETVRQNYRKIS